MTLPISSPKWPAPDNIKAFYTLRHSGFSQGNYDSFNLGQHVGDDSASVDKNRQLLSQLINLPEQPRWLSQTHSNKVINSLDWLAGIEADAIVSHSEHHVCPILTADCLPILLCNRQGTAVAAIHAGWRGLASNIIEQSLEQFPAKAGDILVWLGPAIGPNKFEVGLDVYHAFTQQMPAAEATFKQSDNNHFLANIYLLAEQQLQQCGVTTIWGGHFCTVSQQSDFFSYRRDNTTGRMASLIWIESN